MVHPGWGWDILAWLSLPVVAVLMGILVWRGLHREFPYFFAFLAITEVAGFGRFAAQFGTRRTYFYVYWISDIAITISIFLAVYDLFGRRIFPSFHKVRLYRLLFPLSGSVILFLACLTALEAPDKRAAFLIESRALYFILVAVLAFFVALMLFIGRQWTRYDFAIAFGFALNAAAFLLTSAMWVRSHYHATTFDRLPTLAYDVACLLWLYCFATGPKIPGSDQLTIDPEMLHAARTWESTLKSWLTPWRGRQ